MSLTLWTPTQAPLWICCRVTAPWDPHLHFTTFKNSIFVKKTNISRTALLNPCPRGIIILHLCTKNDNHMMYGRVQLNRLSFVTQNMVLNFHEVFFIMSLHSKMKRQKLLQLYMDLWHLNNNTKLSNTLNTKLCWLCSLFSNFWETWWNLYLFDFTEYFSNYVAFDKIRWLCAKSTTQKFIEKPQSMSNI